MIGKLFDARRQRHGKDGQADRRAAAPNASSIQRRDRPVAPRRGRRHPHRLLPDRARPRRERPGRRGRRSIGCLNRDSAIDERQDALHRHRPPGHRALPVRRQGARRSRASSRRTRSSRSPTIARSAIEPVEPQPDAKDQRTYWRTYYLDRAVRLTGSAISNAMGSYDPEHEPPDRPARLQPLRRPRVRRSHRADRRQEARDDPRRQGQERADHQRRDPRRPRLDHDGRQRRPSARSASARSWSTCSRPARCPRRCARSRPRRSARRSAATRSTRPSCRSCIGIVPRHPDHGRHLPLVGLDRGVRGRVPHRA